MKMSNVVVENKAGGKVKVTAEFRDRMKRTAGVSVSVSKGEMAPSGPSTVLEGDLHEVGTTLNSLAEIAWNMGWRPPGLAQTMEKVVTDYKFRTG